MELYPNREFYCTNQKTLPFDYYPTSFKSQQNKSLQEVYKSEIKLHKLLYKFTDRLRDYLKETTQDENLSKAVKHTLNLKEAFHDLAIGRSYDDYIKIYKSREAATISQSKNLNLSGTGKKCITKGDLNVNDFKLASSDQPIKNYGLMLLSLGASKKIADQETAYEAKFSKLLKIAGISPKKSPFPKGSLLAANPVYPKNKDLTSDNLPGSKISKTNNSVFHLYIFFKIY